MAGMTTLFGQCAEWNVSNDPHETIFVTEILGPNCPTVEVVVPTLTAYLIIFIVGLVGNLFTCLVIARHKWMHTATNFYLFSLAAADLVSLLLGMPFEFYEVGSQRYPYAMPLFICKGRSFLTEMTSYASILTILAFSIERWVAICYPLKLQVYCRLKRAKCAIAGIWSVACLGALPVYHYFTINQLAIPVSVATDFGFGELPIFDSDSSIDNPELNHSVEIEAQEMRDVPGALYCYLDQAEVSAQKTIISVSFFLFFVVPLLCIALVFLHIALVLASAERRFSGESANQIHTTRRTGSRAVVIKMLAAVITAFFICWLPFHIQRLVSVYSVGTLDPVSSKILEALFYVTGCFYYGNSAINPILYSLLNQKFRRAFLRLIVSCACGDNSATARFGEESALNTPSAIPRGSVAIATGGTPQTPQNGFFLRRSSTLPLLVTPKPSCRKTSYGRPSGIASSSTIVKVL